MTSADQRHSACSGRPWCWRSAWRSPTTPRSPTSATLDRLLRHAAVGRVELGDRRPLGRGAGAEEVQAAADVHEVVGGVVDGVAEQPGGVDGVVADGDRSAPVRGRRSSTRAGLGAAGVRALAASRSSAASIGSGSGVGRRAGVVDVEVVDGERRVEQAAHVWRRRRRCGSAYSRGRPDLRRRTGLEHARRLPSMVWRHIPARARSVPSVSERSYWAPSKRHGLAGLGGHRRHDHRAGSWPLGWRSCGRSSSGDGLAMASGVGTTRSVRRPSASASERTSRSGSPARLGDARGVVVLDLDPAGADLHPHREAVDLDRRRRAGSPASARACVPRTPSEPVSAVSTCRDLGAERQVGQRATPCGRAGPSS